MLLLRRFSATLLPIFFISGCLDSNGRGAGTALIPDVTLECNIASATDCTSANTGAPVFAGLISDTSIQCDIYLSNLSSAELTAAFDASGHGFVSYSHSQLETTLSSWVGPTTAPISELPLENFVVCAFIDTNNNNQADIGEPLGEGSLVPGTAEALIDAWFDL